MGFGVELQGLKVGWVLVVWRRLICRYFLNGDVHIWRVLLNRQPTRDNPEYMNIDMFLLSFVPPALFKLRIATMCSLIVRWKMWMSSNGWIFLSFCLGTLTTLWDGWTLSHWVRWGEMFLKSSLWLRFGSFGTRTVKSFRRMPWEKVIYLKILLFTLMIGLRIDVVKVTPLELCGYKILFYNNSLELFFVASFLLVLF